MDTTSPNTLRRQGGDRWTLTSHGVSPVCFRINRYGPPASSSLRRHWITRTYGGPIFATFDDAQAWRGTAIRRNTEFGLLITM